MPDLEQAKRYSETMFVSDQQRFGEEMSFVELQLVDRGERLVSALDLPLERGIQTRIVQDDPRVALADARGGLRHVGAQLLIGVAQCFEQLVERGLRPDLRQDLRNRPPDR